MKVSQTRKLARFIAPIEFLMLAFVLQACGKEEIRVYQVSKETVALPPSAAEWKLPAGWIEQQAGGMRVGSFRVEGQDGQSADVSVIPLSGVAGTDLDNLNRWRVQQLGLSAVDAEGMSKIEEAVSIGEVKASMFDLIGTDPKSNKPTQILAAISRSAGSTWFFKMVGPTELVATQKSSFVQFLESFSFPGSSSSSPVDHSTHQHDPAPTQNASSSPGLPSWVVPQSWQEKPATSMLLAKFLVEDDNLGKAEITISSFPGDVGGLLRNVNRWRNQLGLEAVDTQSLATVTSSIAVGDETSTLVDMTNSDSATPSSANRILVAVVPHKDKTWFFKMLGNDQLVDREKPGFMKFLQSIKFPNAP